MKNLVLFFVLLTPHLTMAQVYKWVDENGAVHFSQTPPNQRPSEKLNLSTPNNASAPTKTIPKTTQKALNSAMQVVLEGDGDADSLDCATAVKNARYSIASMLSVGQRNYRDGYIDREEYDRVSQALRDVKANVSERECVAASGPVRDFYLCMSNDNNHVAHCGKKYDYGDH